MPEATQDADENEASPARQNTDRPVAIPEVKVETIDTPVSSPRVSKRAAKPGRPGTTRNFVNVQLISRSLRLRNELSKLL